MKYYIGPEGKHELLAHAEGLPVITDILLASSTIVVALWAGVEKIIPVEDAEEALSIGKELRAVLVGERGGTRIEGFDYNSSPIEMLEARLAGKTMVLTTSHGTRVMVEGGIIASTLNAGAVANHIKSRNHVYMLASGTGEDLMAARLIEFLARTLNWHEAGGARRLIASEPECLKLLEDIRHSATAERLSRLGHANDIDLICSAINRFPIVPIYRNGYIIRHRA